MVMIRTVMPRRRRRVVPGLGQRGALTHSGLEEVTEWGCRLDFARGDRPKTLTDARNEQQKSLGTIGCKGNNEKNVRKVCCRLFCLLVMHFLTEAKE